MTYVSYTACDGPRCPVAVSRDLINNEGWISVTDYSAPQEIAGVPRYLHFHTPECLHEWTTDNCPACAPQMDAETAKDLAADMAFEDLRTRPAF